MRNEVTNQVGSKAEPKVRSRTNIVLTITFLTFLTFLTLPSYASHLLPKEENVKKLEWTSEYIIPALVLEATYDNHIGPNPKTTNLYGVTAFILTGPAARKFEKDCGCVGLFDFSEPNIVYIIGDSTEDPLQILLHELVHVLQYQSKRITVMLPELREIEAEYFSRIVMETIKDFKDCKDFNTKEKKENKGKDLI